MPELPEVETVCRGLAEALQGRLLVRAATFRADLRRPFPPAFAERLQGRRIETIARRAKYMTLYLDDGWVWLIHLGMSGRMLIGPADDAPPGKHDHVLVETDQGRRVTYNDARRFGLMDLFPAADMSNHPLLKGLGPEPLDDAFTPAVLSRALVGKSGPIKTVLLDQTVVAGIGNIYASESLFRARILPDRPAETITGKQSERLVKAIKSVLTEAIAAGGSSLRDHRRPNGELGYFQHAFAVYDREGEPCPGCTCAEGVRRIVQAGRSTFFCAKRQK
ncbi:bifunctional DNA-formamidopyrimidine glycosylase/DNA-(apurinic or apyrimidinic site) lyase [Telmatospirillum sp.]|uniref:bifunctional DNA-formamidopyrimidine glycosylase/DNA-(apurinic or apyrimidinic site) lyase n=1 Tax=Telmatospirillum sp. TaxID=2079197 RepID=UPI00283DE3EF|nr:bifunctional DNA-formamidopyrimidine glycosylase/DNA-(apurinic or apyrimidinic site) lyase [Telmatospirillum sp.]MDR3437528.1 bifunctional DNA-formamidopyrimidine glycosylase/DNA-(apurinic or apyrimidinic site) lyase [Telmatospirillum sp.]